MKNIVFMLCLVIILTGLSPIGMANSVYAGNVQVLVHKDNAVSTMTRRDLRRLFQVNKKQWDDGDQVILLLPPADSEAMAFLVKNVFKVKNVSAVSMFYLKAAFQQKLTRAPAATLSTEDAVRKIAALRGAVTLVDAGTVQTPAGVRLVSIE